MPRPRSRMRAALAPILGHPAIVPATALALRARTVRPSWRFAARELARRDGLVLYRLRRGVVQVGIRHRTGDVVTLGEVFHELDYDPPAEVLERLGPAPRIVDLGANVGLFGAYAAQRWPTADITAYEPDPANAAVHRRVVEANALGERWRVVEAAAGSAAGTARFTAGQAALSHLAADGEIEVRVEDVLPVIAGADLLKMDIEGGEWAILSDPRFAAEPPRALAMEYHPGGAGGGDPQARAEAALAAAGMIVQRLWHREHGAGMLWAWRP